MKSPRSQTFYSSSEIQGNKAKRSERDKAAKSSQWSHCGCRSRVTNVCWRAREAVKNDCTPGTEPNSCLGRSLLSVTSVCFTILLIIWNAASEIELGRSAAPLSPLANAQRMPPVITHVAFQFVPLTGLVGRTLNKFCMSALPGCTVRWGFLLYDSLHRSHLLRVFCQLCVLLCLADKQC